MVAYLKYYEFDNLHNNLLKIYFKNKILNKRRWFWSL